jgi:hypothetical protein
VISSKLEGGHCHFTYAMEYHDMYKHLFQFNSCELAQMSLSEFFPFQSIWTSCSQPSGYNDHRNMVRKSTS